MLDSQEKNELLILYFGNDSIKRNYPRERLLFEENNEGKNNLIVELLEELAREFSDFSRDVKNKRYEQLEKAIEIARKRMYDNEQLVEIGVEYTEGGDEIPVLEPHVDMADIAALQKAKKALQDEEKKIDTALGRKYFNIIEYITQHKEDLHITDNDISIITDFMNALFGKYKSSAIGCNRFFETTSY